MSQVLRAAARIEAQAACFVVGENPDERRAGREPAGMRGVPGGTELASGVARNFTAAYTVVAPLLAVQQIGTGIEGLHERAVAATHPTVPADLVSVAAAGGDRRPEAASNLVLAFQPAPGAALCQVQVHTRLSPARFQAGETVMVVPRSDRCEAPVLPVAAADPAAALALAAALLLSAMGAWNIWHRLETRTPHPEPAWTRAGAGLLGRRS